MNASADILVSIGIPTYNRADGYLRQALKSALAQTWPHIEIIVADNCSSDRTDDLVEGFGDPRIRYFKHSENIGANNNFNFCVEQARGKYFLLLHDDDLIDEDFVETCLKAASGIDGDVGIIRAGTRIIDKDGKVRKEIKNMVHGLATEDFFRGWFQGKTALYLCSTLFNTEKLKNSGGFRSRTNLFQDVIAEFLLAAKFGRIDVPEVKASYRKHSETITYVARVGDWCKDSLMLLDLMCELAGSEKEAVKVEGKQYLARTNYRRAKLIKSPHKRIAAFWLVYKTFDYQYMPPADFILSRRLYYFWGQKD